MWEEKVSFSGPYDFDLALSRLALDPLHSVDIEKRHVKIPLSFNNKKIVAEVIGTGTLEKPEFLIRADNEKESTLDRLSEIFQWDVKLIQIHEHFQTTELKDLFIEHYGTPLVLEFDPFSSLVKSIIHQQVNLKFAFTLTERFVKSFGEELDGVWYYPNPEKVAQLTVEQLRELQFSGRKAEYVIGIAEMTASGQLDFEKMKTMPDAEVTRELIKIRGVGPWTVENFLMFALGRPNLFPMGDIGIQNALKKYFSLEEKPTPAEMEKFKEPWNPYLSYASLYLWRSIE
ncbi:MULTISPECIES: DNA-3-methyladenine glycosylase [unclassified Bacillus (in: firmicutes)]|uniref:DNA-3-methyladenine glycosylase family protein n=1 Tax=unclassified Bacillus (in: firmicutes) TaxID=185979 RepID=UPI001BEAB7D6|nr:MULTISPECIES: DNA-3-methyladenine glycosylase [unclassified Bacillus (in: firmicutes)]MBT2637681.1 DNA-3-methyladenine glycosylase 2 family protein [Bacillus sp. ISL-39]MBT2662023.1 DNA-3-methyladenine glycosylase 2 family protein [Bacillus sp. ISL-45]